MVGVEQFLAVFGDIRLEFIVILILAGVFIWNVCRQVKAFLDKKADLLIEKHEADRQKDEQIKQVLHEVNQYPKYREQSRQIQQTFQREIDELKLAQTELSNTQQEIHAELKQMKETNDRRERNKIRDRLLQSYRYYTNKETNPNQTWTRMESEAFWALFRDYEEAGGNDYMHSVVQPAMNLLTIIEN